MNTSSVDYRINTSNIVRIETLVRNNKVDVYIALWRDYQKVCVKQIENDEKVDNELCVLSKCMHPKIVQFFGAGKNENHTCMLFEYMENGDLENYIKKHKLDNKKKLDLMLDVAIGVHYLHNRNPEIVLHRDLKPENILINKHGDAKIADFGISKLVNTDSSQFLNGHTGETGTYLWMSPEVLKHEEYNYKSDIYSLGLIIYYIWTEEKPFLKHKMNTIQLMFAKFQDGLTVGATNHEKIDALIKRCCSFVKEDRPSSNDVIESLKEIMTDFVLT